MRTLLLAAAMTAAAAGAAPAFAQEQGGYAGVGYTHFDGDADISVGAISGRLGYKFTPNFAVEGEVGFGVKDDNVGPIEVSLDNYVGAFGVGFLPLTPQLELFGRIGYAQATIEGSLAGITVDSDADGFAYGLGGQVSLTERVGLRGEYTRIDGDDGESDTFSASAVFKF